MTCCRGNSCRRDGLTVLSSDRLPCYGIVRLIRVIYKVSGAQNSFAAYFLAR